MSIYRNDLLRKLIVLPLGGETITKDICAERISREEAEQIKISRGYNSTNSEGLPFSLDTLNKIIGARMQEILLNVKHQIEISGEIVPKILFTGGSEKIKNLKALLDEHLTGYNTQIIWWNFNSRNITCPEMDSYGNIFFSGYNPMLLKFLEVGFDAKEFLKSLLTNYAKAIQ